MELVLSPSHRLLEFWFTASQSLVLFKYLIIFLLFATTALNVCVF